MRDLLTCARDRWPLDGRWISAGHSEGAMAAMHAVAGGPVDGFDLRTVVAFAPVTRMSQTIGAAQRLPVVLPGFQVVTALIALMVDGAATTSAPLRTLLGNGGLSGEALALWPQLGERSLVELCERDSFGALAPRALLGPRGPRCASACSIRSTPTRWPICDCPPAFRCASMPAGSMRWHPSGSPAG